MSMASRIGRVRSDELARLQDQRGLIEAARLRERIGGTIVNLDIFLRAGRQSSLAIDMISLAGIDVSWHSSRALSMERGARHIEGEDIRDVTLTMPLLGGFRASQGRFDRLVEQGSGVMLAASRESTIEVPEGAEFIGVRLSAAALERHGAGADLARWHEEGARQLNATSPSFKLLRGYLFGLHTICLDFSEEEVELASRHIVELARATMARSNGEGGLGDAALCASARALMRRHYQDATLSSGDLAAWLGLPVARLQRAFLAEGSGIEQELTTLRLSHLGRALQNPEQRSRPTGELAVLHGFADIEEMNRAFRKLYGIDAEGYRRLRRA